MWQWCIVVKVEIFINCNINEYSLWEWVYLIIVLKLQSKIFKRCIAICLLFSYLLTNNLFYSYVCYWNDKSYITPQWNPCKKYKIGIIMGGFGYMDKFTGKIGYVMYSENRTQNGIRPDMRNRLWRAISLWKEGHLEKILITGDMVAYFFI